MRRTEDTRSAHVWIGICAVGAALAFGGVISPPTANADDASTGARPSDTSVAIDAVVNADASSALRSIPTGFARAYYSPTVENGVLVNPGGDCSSPVALPSEFDTACKAHDLGYDLLRFGADVGSRSPAEAREELDTTLTRRMHEACDSRAGIGSRTACDITADVAGIAVQFNSWRQNYDAPIPEPALPYLLTSGAVLLTAAGAVAIGSAVRGRTVTA